MLRFTRPFPTPKRPFSSRAEALAEGQLVDLGALMPGNPDDALGLPCGLSARLVERVEEVPFAQLRSTSAGRRLSDLVARAAAALHRARSALGEGFTGASMLGFVLDFCVSLPRRSGDPRYGFVRLHCGPDDNGEICATLSETDEFPLDGGDTAQEGTRSGAPAISPWPSARRSAQAARSRLSLAELIEIVGRIVPEEAVAGTVAGLFERRIARFARSLSPAERAALQEP